MSAADTGGGAGCLAYRFSTPACWLEVTGEDAATYLQSQFSNDLRRPGVGRPVTYGLWLDRKGKVAADSFILQGGPERFWIFSYHCPGAAVGAKLDANLVADEVEWAERSGGLRTLALWGPPGSVTAALGELGLPRPGPGTYAIDAAATTWVFPGRHTRGENVDGVFPAAAEPALKEVLGRVCPGGEAGAEALAAARIAAGIPGVPQDIGPGDLPQEGGLEADAVSLSKGCYLGQEVMARLASMGRVQRGLRHVSLGAPPPPLPADLFAGDAAVGQLRSAAPGPDGGAWMGLALLRHAAAGTPALALSPGGPGEVRLGPAPPAGTRGIS